MAQTSILTAITLPGVTTTPSPTCLQWSGDGQAILLSRTAVYILTPQLGVNLESPLLIKQSLDKDKIDNRRSVEWLRTMIEWDKDTVLHQWPSDCQDWGAVSLGSLDHHFRAVACSPNNLTSNAGCILAVLTSNMEVSLWAASKNHLTGVWTKLGNYCGPDNPLESPNGTVARLYKTLQAQVTSIAWSTQADFAISPTPYMDVSLLALGSRAGIVCLARYSRGSNSQNCLQHIALFSVADKWVTHLAWSSWSISQSGQSEAYLACGISDGSIVVAKVSQSLREILNSTSFIKEHECSVSCEVLSDKACEVTSKGITSLQWVATSKLNQFLVFSTPGQLHIWSSAQGSDAWITPRVMTLRNVKTSTGSTLLAPLSGVSYIRRFDVLVISLADGSFHSVSHFSTDPRLVPASQDSSLSAEALSDMSHSVFLKVEERYPEYMYVSKIGGMVAFDYTSTHAWVEEAVRPASFDYKHDAKHSSTFVVARLWSENPDEALLDDIARLTTVQSAPGYSPLGILRPIFMSLQDPPTISRLHAEILEVLKNCSLVTFPDTELLPLWSSSLCPDTRSAFRKSLRGRLFRSHGFNSQHLVFLVAKFCQKHAENPNEQKQFANFAEKVSNTIWEQVLRMLIRHVVACAAILSDTEVPFVLRIVVQALLPGTSADLELEARELSAKVNKVVTADYDLNTLGPEELCPACQAPVPFQNKLQGVCTNGHTWVRCSITSFILSTPMVRTCVGCGCKALLPPPRDDSGAYWLPNHLRSWLAEDLLNAVRRCLFCGNSFVTSL